MIQLVAHDLFKYKIANWLRLYIWHSNLKCSKEDCKLKQRIENHKKDMLT